MLPIYRYDNDGNLVFGTGLPAFIHNVDYMQVIIGVYADGMIDCWGLINLEQFRQKVKEGWVVTEVPEGRFIKCGRLHQPYVLGDMEYKDTPIKQILSGDNLNQMEFEHWRKRLEFF